MLLRPLRSSITSDFNRVGSNSSFPSLTRESPTFHLAPMEEYRESLEIEGELLMLPILNKENSLKRNKQIHDNFKHENTGIIYNIDYWTICDCEFAWSIRCSDLGIDLVEQHLRYDTLRKVI